MNLSVAFRVDANRQIGTGHFMRCLTLASALCDRGIQVRFLCRGLPSYLSDMLTLRKIDFAPLNTSEDKVEDGDLAHSAWLGTTQEKDAFDVISALHGREWDWLIVDHYALDARWERAIQSSVKRVMVIDDLADRAHACDLLLDQNYYLDAQTRYDTKVSRNCRQLLGPNYALLRDEFKKLRKKLKPRNGEAKHMLIFFGGVDPYNYTGMTISALSGMEIKGIEVDVVIGAQHPNRMEIQEQCATQGYVCHVQTPRMAELAGSADIAIGAGGSASWERCCLGLPALVLAFADNQIKLSKDLASVNASIFIGAMKAVTVQVIQDAISNALNNPKHLSLVSRKAYSLVDGLGVQRVVKVLIEN